MAIAESLKSLRRTLCLPSRLQFLQGLVTLSSLRFIFTFVIGITAKSGRRRQKCLLDMSIIIFLEVSKSCFRNEL